MQNPGKEGQFIRRYSTCRLTKEPQCSEEKPCDSCPKRPSASTPWKLVGCKRGALGEEMEAINLCPQSYIQQAVPQRLPSSPQFGLVEYTGQEYVDASVERRKKYLEKEYPFSINGSPAWSPVYRYLREHEELLPSQQLLLILEHHDLTSLKPLDECILAILWEFLDQPERVSCLSHFDGASAPALANFAVLLRSAAVYQARLEDV